MDAGEFMIERNVVRRIDAERQSPVSNASRHAWMLYGAYGTTGRMILDEALRRGHRPLLAGRDPSRLAALASELGLDSLALPLDSSDGATPALGGVSAILNAAGPFFRTGGPLRKLCLEG